MIQCLVLIANYSLRRQSKRSASHIFVFVGRAVYPVAVFWDRLVNLYRPARSQCFGSSIDPSLNQIPGFAKQRICEEHLHQTFLSNQLKAGWYIWKT